MQNRDSIKAILVTFLTAVGIYAIGKVLLTDYIFGAQQYVGLSLLAVSILLFFVNRRAYRYVFGVTLLLGLVNLVGFTVAIKTTYFFGLQIQVLLIPVVLIYGMIHRDQIKPKIQSLFGNSEGQMERKSDSQVDNFKRRFGKLTDKQIESKIGDNLLPEAIEALRQIRKEREGLL